VRDGARVCILVYSPQDIKPDDSRHLVVLMYSGGFILRSAEIEMPTCVTAVREYGYVTVSLEHRLSPEVKFPVAYNDCWDTLV
jgi:acetyl esterase/lipase